MKNQPKFIYLQTGLEEYGEVCEDFNTLDSSSISWCADKIFDDDLKYISVDFLFAEINRRILETQPTKENALEVGKRIIFLENFRNELNNLIK
jgi:hypothetical protein